MLQENQQPTAYNKKRFNWRSLLLIFLAIPLLASSFAFFNTTDAFAAITDAECENLIKSGLGSKTKDNCHVRSMPKKKCEDYGGKSKSGSIVGSSCDIPIDNKSAGGDGGDKGTPSDPKTKPEDFTCKDGTVLEYNTVKKEWACAKKVDLKKNECKSSKDKEYFWADKGAAGGACYEVVGEPEKVEDKEEEGEESKCKIDTLGWILCPVFELMGGISDAAYGLVALMLTVPPIMTNGDSEGVYSAWKSMRNVANVAFVIAFLIIIFSQVTSIGFSNYNIKKMVPRLVMAAILVNISFWICAIAVDLSNILGSSIKSVFDGMSNNISVKNNGDFWSGDGPAYGAIVLGVISGTLIAATADIMMLLAGLVPVLITVFIAILTVFVVLTARQAIIILLIVISPLAFVAMLLPNTENWFTRWRQLFQIMLLMFPIIAGIFGASALAAIVVMNSTDNIAVQILGAGIAVVPLALTPIVMKTAGGMLNKIGAFVNNPNRGPLDKVRNRASDYQKRRANISKARKLGDNTRLLNSARKLKSSDNRFVRGVGKTMGLAGSAAAYNAKFDENAKQKNKYAEVYADAEARNYSTKKVVGDGSIEGIAAGKDYAMKVAAGNEGVATLVQAYGVQSVREEDAKDIKAERALIEFADVSTLFDQMNSGSATSAAAAAAEIASRGGGDKIQDALDMSAQIEDQNKRRLVQQQLISNMGPDEFGLGHGDKSALSTGTYGRKINRETGADEGYDTENGTYDKKMVGRLENKASGETIANMQPHDVAKMEQLANEGKLTEKAINNITKAIGDARANDNTNSRIKSGDQIKLDNIIANQQSGNYIKPQEQKITQEIKHTGQETLKISHEVASTSQGGVRSSDVGDLTTKIDKAAQSIDRANKAMDQKISQQAAQQKARENLGYQDRS